MKAFCPNTVAIADLAIDAMAEFSYNGTFRRGRIVDVCSRWLTLKMQDDESDTVQYRRFIISKIDRLIYIG